MLDWLFGRKPTVEAPLLWLGPRDYLTMHQCYEGVLAIGGTGSGKTSTMSHLMRALMQRGVGMLVLTAKGSDAAEVRRIAEESGRAADFVHFTAGGPHKFDFLDYELRARGGSVETAAQMMQDLVDFSTQSRANQSHEPFFPLMAARQMRMAIVAIWKAYGRCSVADVYRFCTSLPTTPEQAAAPEHAEWRAGSFACQTLALADANSGDDDQDLAMACDFVMCEWSGMSDRTQGGVSAQTNTTLSRFMTSDVRPLTASGETNCSPDDVLAGKIVVVDTPVLVYREPGQFVQMVWKLSMIRAALRREMTPDARPVVLWVDEAQLFALGKVDSMTQAVARSHRLINVAITQSDSLLVSVMKSPQEAHAWMSNMMSRFSFASNDNETRAYLSRSIGMSKQLMMSGTSAMRQPYDPVGDWLGEPQGGGASFSEQYLPLVREEDYGKLLKGGAENGFLVTCYFTQAGRVFSNGKPFLLCSFKQRV